VPRSDTRLLLASQSPRRRELLRACSIEHEVIDSGIDDTGLIAPGVSPLWWVMALAYLKARSGWDRLGDRAGAVVLGADTLVIKGASIIGQPTDEADARAIISTLNDGTHDVATGVALLDERGRRVVWVDIAHVRVGNVPEADRENYLLTGNWQGKAWAYNFAERLDDGWPISCEDDPTTVMGLPMKMLPGILDRFASRAARAGASA